jgi:hypothetical protein
MVDVYLTRSDGNIVFALQPRILSETELWQTAAADPRSRASIHALSPEHNIILFT